MNSTIESGGSAFTAKSPNYANQLGMDLDVFPNLAALTNNQTTASLELQLHQRVLHALGVLPRLRRGPGDDQRPAERDPPAGGGPAHDGETLSAGPGHLERHGHADLHLSVAALRRRRQWLPGHRGRHQQHLHADRRRRRRHGPRRRHRHQRRRSDVQRLRADRGRRRAAGQHRAAHASRAGDGGPAARRRRRPLDRHRPRRAGLSVAALRRGRQQLPGHRGRHRQHLHAERR